MLNISRQGTNEPAFLVAVTRQQARSFDAAVSSKQSTKISSDLSQKSLVLQIVLKLNCQQSN